ncbi:dihydrolipoamide S-acyltransferase [Haladaptatus paucihalophilus DX253]|uniref:Dihydrolipoamide S-acyltransferase n=1 Tax=Haladaptatus paucihalophilus DX253 TaxID=797209 RepID=E7QVV7_HALPU|nr:2-oxo acid dehydrogenase subunit E2 [Haladaptatus paucihalophilus]EFW91370.1 dihydrolipoamide S-acyltransferase [Haladaptatus paucihalophilus DX253]SHL12113.1 pyruvate dehydrogenase E2 component (dihydrolipoamide acetyltransferase) [Haladaptatus paucihalophilus DX253]
MGYIVKMPKLGLEMDSGTLNAWTVSEGDAIAEGDVIAEIESEKTTAEIDAREEGVLRRVFVEEGDVTDPGAPLGIVAAPDADIDGLVAEVEGASAETPSEASSAAASESTARTADRESAAESSGTATTQVKATPRAKRRADELGVDLTTIDGTGPQGAIDESDVEAAAESETAEPPTDVKATPRAKRRAEELDVALHTVEGTGPQGAVTEGDVEAAAEATEAESMEAEAAEMESEAKSAAEPDVPSGRVFATPSARRLARELGVDVETVGAAVEGPLTESDVRLAVEGTEYDEPETVPGTRDEERPLTGMRRTIADRLGQSDREAVHVTEHRSADAEELLAAAAAADEALAPDVSVTDVLLTALSAALDAHPEFNATFEDGVHQLHESHNICVAVDIDAGLIAPVIRDVDSLSLSELAARRREVTARALSGEYTMDDLTGGTMTVSNLGVLGVERFDPVINPPQIAILGVNAIKREVVPTDDDEVAVRKRISFSLSFDHRIVDGADAARFLGTLVEHVENPWPLVIAAGEK